MFTTIQQTILRELILNQQLLKFATDPNQGFSSIMETIQKAAYIGAGILMFWGAVEIGTNFGESGNRTAVVNGFWRLMGGVIVGGAAKLFLDGLVI